ncbi:MAG TPA: reverse transcriptase domain-containing protein [Ktedonobacteraceae bacterium]|nr:reverse transcriptase domain-containing protein [Ktedonobacteraceae bacterium]
MRTAETLLNIIQDRGKRKLPLDDVYRQLYNPDFSLRSYAKMYKNDGAMTPGTTEETVDGMSLNKIDQVIEIIRCERWKWPPVRRVLIDKPQGGKRPLGIPDWSPKVVQDIVRSILEAYYEPQFSDHSHGFRPKRGCQSALTKIHNTWNGTKWFIEGDIKGCFDNIDHHILMNILRENIHDNRFLRLIEGALKAGYCEDWIYHPSLSGSPQGGIVSPILSNIYLDKLDKFVEKTLIPEYTKSDKRETNPAYGHVANQLQTARRQGNLERVKALQKELRKHPSKTQDDPGYRRLRYIRYADDFLFGFAGPFEESHQIKDKVASFLQTELKLPLSAEKTLITHAHTGRARFLGYEIGIMYSATKLDDRFRRSVNGAVGMYIPEDVIQAKRKRYLRDGKPIHRPELQNDSEYDIIVRYQGEYRGLVQYYGLAQNLAQLGYVKWTMETSLLKTLASKNQTSTTKESKRLQATIKTSDGPRKCLQLIIQREKKKPLVATFGGLSLKRRKNPVIEDRVILPYVRMRSEIVERLLNDTCEVCGGKANIQMHHVRHLRDLNKKGKKEMPLWMKIMISRKRKSIPLCKGCHDDVHSNRPKSKK